MTTTLPAIVTRWDAGTGRVSIPEGRHGRAEVHRFTIGPNDLANAMAAIKHGRGTAPGTYTALSINGRLWMTDTDAEWRDHLDAVLRIRRPATRRVLVNGLGIGMVVQAALDCPHVERVDVVEIDPDVVALVGPHYAADPRVTIHEADAYTIKWPTGTRWDVAWHDLWEGISEDNLPGMGRLHRRYGGRVGWQGSWCKERILANRRRDRAHGWR